MVNMRFSSTLYMTRTHMKHVQTCSRRDDAMVTIGTFEVLVYFRHHWWGDGKGKLWI